MKQVIIVIILFPFISVAFSQQSDVEVVKGISAKIFNGEFAGLRDSLSTVFHDKLQVWGSSGDPIRKTEYLDRLSSPNFIHNKVTIGVAQKIDSTKTGTIFSGTLGVTTNGFSIIPSFSLNSPGIIALLSWRKNKFSIDPDIRLSPDLKKGGILLWFRYQLVERKKFSLRIGAHPGLNLQERVLTENARNTAITQMRRFLAWEFVPNYSITKNWTVGVYYLQGNGLQKDGPLTTHFVTFNSGVSNIKLSSKLYMGFYPSVYYLYLDGYEGRYLTATAALTPAKLPFSLEYTINKTFSSSLPGNKDFMWCLTLKYNFHKTLVIIK